MSTYPSKEVSNISKMESNFRKIVESKVKSELQTEIEDIIKESDSKDPSEIMKKLNLDPLVTEIAQSLKKPPSSKRNQNAIWSDLGLDYSDYPRVIENLKSNSTINKLKALDELLNSQIIDTKTKHWEELSQSLRRFFVSSNSEIFTRSLKIHYRIVSFPPTSIDGYFNLLQGISLLLHSRFFNEPKKLRIFNSLQVVFATQRITLRALLHVNHKIIDEIAAVFTEIISFKTIIEIVAELDRKAEWLCIFCYGGYIRTTIFNQLMNKFPRFVKSLMEIVINGLTGFESLSFKSLSHHCYFLGYFLSFKNNLGFFPCILEDKREVTTSSLLEVFIMKIQHQNPEGRLELIEILVGIFQKNSNLFNAHLLSLLIRPLETSPHNFKETEYIFDIIINLSKSSNSEILSASCNKLKRVNRGRGFWRKTTNCGQIIIDVANGFLEDSIKNNSCEVEKSKEVLKLYKCCLYIYQSHSVTFHYINPNKFISNLHDFYVKGLGTTCLRKIILDLCKYFYSYYGHQTFNLVENYMGILVDLFSIRSFDDIKPVINSVACEKFGSDFLRNQKITKFYLENIWFLEEDEMNFFTITDKVDEAIANFISFLFTARYNYKATLALLNESEGTVVESNEKSSTLKDLIEKCVEEYQNSSEEYLGLLAVKVLVTNLDVMLYFEANYQVQEKLKILQEFSKNNAGIPIVDAHSTLRFNILNSLEYPGFLKPNLDVNILGSTEFPKYQPPPVVLKPADNSEFQMLLKDGPKNNESGDFGWIHQARRAFKNSPEVFDLEIFMDLLVQGPKSYVYRKIELKWPPPDCVYFKLYPEDLCGISVIIKFGIQSKLLQASEDHSEVLALLIKQSRAFLGHQPEEFSNFDWFLGLTYLTCKGDISKCQKLLMDLTRTHVVPLIWTTFGKEFDYPIQDNFYEQINMVMEENCSECYQALKMLGVSCETIVRFWLDHSFFNILSLEEICNFWQFSLLYSPETLLYYFVAIFQHLSTQICTNTHSLSVDNLLKMMDLSGFKLNDHLNAIEQLAKQYRNVHKL